MRRATLGKLVSRRVPRKVAVVDRRRRHTVIGPFEDGQFCRIVVGLRFRHYGRYGRSFAEQTLKRRYLPRGPVYGYENRFTL